MNKYTNKEFISHTQNISVIRWQSAYLPIVEVIKQIKNYQKEKILDFGCGSAAANQIMRKIYDLNIDGVDISPEMIHVAKKNDSAGGYRVLEEDVTIPFKSNSYISCYASFVFVEMESIEQIKHWLKEIYRILKSSGLIILLINNLSLAGKVNPVYSQIVKFGEKRKKYNIGDQFEITLYGVPGKNIPDISFKDYYWPIDIFRKIIKNIGFKNFDYKVQKNNNFIKKEIKNLHNHGIKMIDTRELEGLTVIVTAQK